MKATILFSSLLIFFLSFTARGQSLMGLDKSPLDISYYPHNFAHDRKEGQNALVRIIYSRPNRNGRQLFGGIVPYGKVWRTGANEATEIQFYSDAVMEGQKIKKGTYSLFTIPEKDKWTIILNSDLDYWGAYKYNQKNDVIRVSVPSEESKTEVENFTIQFAGEEKDKASMLMAWGNTIVKVPIQF